MNKHIDSHWAVCCKDGAILYDTDGCAHIYENRKLCHQVAKEKTANNSEQYYAKKVEIK